MPHSHNSVLDAKRTPSSCDASIVLGLVACLIVGGALDAAVFADQIYRSAARPEIVYVAADATTGELAFKVHNAGDGKLYIWTFYVNATPVSSRVPLQVSRINQMALWGGAYGTVVLPYSGPWNGSILITLQFRTWFLHNHSQEVDLDVASTNPVSGAYPTPFEQLPGFLRQHEVLIGIAFVVVLLVVVVAIAILLRRRGRVSLLVFLDEVLAFGIYFVVLWEVVDLGPLVSTLVSSGFSVLTVYALLTYRSKRQQPVRRVREQYASTE